MIRDDTILVHTKTLWLTSGLFVDSLVGDRISGVTMIVVVRQEQQPTSESSAA